MTTAQQITMMRRLELEQEVWELRKQMRTGDGCQHFVIKGSILFSPRQEKIVWTHEGLADNWNDGCFSATCAVCGADLGWWCPKSPTHYCEYDGAIDIYGCKWCHEPDERK